MHSGENGECGGYFTISPASFCHFVCPFIHMHVLDLSLLVRSYSRSHIFQALIHQARVELGVHCIAIKHLPGTPVNKPRAYK